MNLLQRYSRTLTAPDRPKLEAARKDSLSPQTWRGQLLSVGYGHTDWDEELVASEVTPSESAFGQPYPG